MSSAAIALREPLRTKFTAAFAAASAVAALYVGRPVLVPLSLALLIAFAFAPVVDALKRWNVKPLPAVLAAMAVAAALLASIALFLAGQFAELADAAPVHRLPLLGEPARRVSALVYMIDRGHVQYAGRLDLATQLHLVRQGHGRSGPNREYVLSTVQALEGLGLYDRDLHLLAERLKGTHESHA